MSRHVKREKAEISTPESRTSDRKKQFVSDLLQSTCWLYWPCAPGDFEKQDHSGTKALWVQEYVRSRERGRENESLPSSLGRKEEMDSKEHWI